MAKLNGQQIRERAKAIVAEHPGGIRYRALVDQIKQENPETPENTIIGNVWDLERTYSRRLRKKFGQSRNYRESLE
jgi:hypothetical protein